MSGRSDKLLVLKVGHFIAINGKRIKYKRTLRSLIEPTVICPTDKGSRRNRDHFFWDRFFTRRLRWIAQSRLG